MIKQIIVQIVFVAIITAHGAAREGSAYPLFESLVTVAEEKWTTEGFDKESNPLCQVCNVSFSFDNFKRHIIKEHSKEEGLLCTFPIKEGAPCNEILPNRPALFSHFKYHGDLPFKCTECPNAFPDERRLIFHREKHLIDRSMMPCSICNCRIQGLHFFINHISTHHAKTEEMACPFASKSDEQCKADLLSLLRWKKADIFGHLKTHIVNDDRIWPN